MSLDILKLPDDIAELHKIIVSLADKQAANESKILDLEEYVRQLKSVIFGRKSEKIPPNEGNQLVLFDEAEVIVHEEREDVVVDSHNRRKPGRKALPPELPRVEVIHDLLESEKVCECGASLSCIGEEVCEKLDIIPARIQVIRHIRYQYACKSCEGIESEAPAVKIAPAPPQIIPKGLATPGLLAYIMTSKFEDALPFYRQEKIFSRIGVEITRGNMANWAIKVAQQSDPLIRLFQQEIRGGPLVNIDETPVQVMKEPDRSNTSLSYMWLYRGGDPDHPVLFYQYHPTRSGIVPLTFLQGYRGYIQTDGFSGYEALAREPGVLHVGCWAHARRKFHEVVKSSAGQGRRGYAGEALEIIGKLYAIEKLADQGSMNVEERRQLRQEKAIPILEGFRGWLNSLSLKTPPKGLLGKAVNYTLSRWVPLVRYTENGLLRPDNNLAENAIRPFVVGRKNWLFSGHPRGAEASATIYSLIETAKANGLQAYHYLRFLFDKLPLAQSDEDYKNLLPQYVDQKNIGADSSS
jgi:transposase